jgi:hypothetical protein
MNIAIGNKTFGRNSRIGFGVLGAGLFAAAIIGGAAVWQGMQSGSSQTATQAPAAPPVTRPVDTSSREVTPVHYYLVTSEAEALALMQADFENWMNHGGVGGEFAPIHVIDVSTPEGAQTARILQEDLLLMSTDPTFDPSLIQVHDLTAPPAVTSTASETARRAYVPSGTGPATIYVVGSEAERQALLLEADTAAAVEGSSAALPDIMVVETPEQELQYANTLSELSQSQSSINIVDLRK